MSKFDDLIDRSTSALARLNTAVKEFNANWRRMHYESVSVRRPVKPNATRRK